MKYDYVIVGCGVATMMFVDALLSKQMANILILEKEDHIGGRIGSECFKNTRVSTGAGIVRSRDVYMREFYRRMTGDKLIMKDSKYMYDFVNGDDKIIDLFSDYLDQASRVLTRDPVRRSDTSVLQLLKSNFSNSVIEKLLMMVAFQDFVDADVVDTFEYYGLQDNRGCNRVALPKWDEFLSGWYRRYGNLVKLDCEVVEVMLPNRVITKYGKMYQAEHVILSVTKHPLKSLLPLPIYDGIGATPFIRIYIETDAPLPIKKGNNITIVPDPIQKIARISDTKYLGAYADGENAIILNNMNKAYFGSVLGKLLNTSVKIKSMTKFFWLDGVHYYKPLPLEFSDREEFIQKATHPHDQIYVMGSLVSRNQGWAEGACESALNVIDLCEQ